LQSSEVVSYEEVASRAGWPKASRAVGNTLRRYGSGDIPWWRVVRVDGSLAAADLAAEQRSRPEAEGVDFVGDRVARFAPPRRS
jgi:methylated-DNA-protein-cysteine methyltransferase related protein